MSRISRLIICLASTCLYVGCRALYSGMLNSVDGLDALNIKGDYFIGEAFIGGC